MSDTFKPLPSSLPFLPQWIQYNAKHSPDHPLFVFSESPHNEPVTITWSQAGKCVQRAAQIVSSSLETGELSSDAPPVIGILATLDSVTYNFLHSGILTSGCTAFLISTRNSPTAISFLLSKTRTSRLYVSSDAAIQSLASSALADARSNGHDVDLLPVPTFQDLFSSEIPERHIEFPATSHKRTLDSPAYILHSSGSTSHPKPIVMSHRIVTQWATKTKISGYDLTKLRLGAHAVPVFHGMGCFLLPWAAYEGVSLAVYPPRMPPMVPTPASFLEGALACRCTYLFSVPIFLEVWSKNSADIAKLKEFDGIIFGGGPLNKYVGDQLSKAGVGLAYLYGTTETGFGSRIVTSESGDNTWEWLHTSPYNEAKFLPQEGNPDLFELAYMITSDYTPAVINIEIDGKGAFATNDLAVRHPTDPTKFKIYGRKDDQIILATGEKINPGPMEAIICKHPSVQSAVMFGHGRFQGGILIHPAKGHEIDLESQTALAAFRNEIWENVKQANDHAPSHSRIYKEMILVANPSKPFEMTPKMTPRRPIVLKDYKDEIEAAYEAVRQSSQTEFSPPISWHFYEVRKFVRTIVSSATGKVMGDDDDIFQHGGDSLQATYIRNSITRAVRETWKDRTRSISQDFVYVHPSIASLSSQLLTVVSGGSEAGDDTSPKLQEMEEIISEFSVDFPIHSPSETHIAPSGEVVLLTGSTGGLGAQLLYQLVSQPDISHIYALNRTRSVSSGSLRERQAEALAERGLDVGILDSPKVTLIEGDTSVADFGIDRSLLHKIRDTTTLIIHNAWRVNFNLALGSFRPMIRGVRHLIDLALQSPHWLPPRIIFTGTVGVFRNWKTNNRPLETSIKDPKIVLGSGYTESKFASERILESAAKTTPLRPIIVRIGQMTSNSSGAWNSGDWVPAIVRSGQVLGCLPARDDSISWIHLDTAAQAIIDFRNSEARYLHLAHPSPVPWNTVFDAFASLLTVPLVDWSEWLSRLEKDESEPENNPALHLLEFFRGSSPVALTDREAPGLPFLDIQEAVKSSETLSDPSLRRVVREDAEAWVGYWRRKRLLVA